MTVSAITSFLLYVFVNAFTPGPGNILALNTAVNFEWKLGKKLYFGIFTGYYVVQILCALFVYGLQQILSPFLNVIKYVGVAYIIFLAVRIAISNPTNENEANAPSFLKGFLLQFVNVKIYMFGITALTVYIAPYYHSLGVLLVSELFIASVGTIATLSWIFAGHFFQRVYLKYYRVINIILALILIQCAVSVIV